LNVGAAGIAARAIGAVTVEEAAIARLTLNVLHRALGLNEQVVRLDLGVVQAKEQAEEQAQTHAGAAASDHGL
jgi:hypothetical protein